MGCQIQGKEESFFQRIKGLKKDLQNLTIENHILKGIVQKDAAAFTTTTIATTD